MNTRTEGIILAETHDLARGITKWYLSHLKGVDMKHQFELNGIKLNSPLWIAAHLIWAENLLVLKSTGGQPIENAWLDQFKFGDEHNLQNLPDVKEILNTMKAVHELSLQHIQSLTDEQLDEPTLTGINFGVDSKRRIIQHTIRHEGTHNGQLGWICKLHGIKTV